MQITETTPVANQAGNSLPLKKSSVSSDKNNEAALKKACQNFEAIILQQMLTTMRKSVPKSGLLDSGFSQDMYQSMYDESLTQKMADAGGIGLAEAMYRQLSKPTPSTHK